MQGGKNNPYLHFLWQDEKGDGAGERSTKKAFA